MKTIFKVKPVSVFLEETAEITRFAGRFFSEVLVHPYEWNEIARQSYAIGFKSLPLVSITAFIMGLVLVIQSRPSLIEFGAGAYLPAMSAASIVREIGPLITSLVCAGNIGSSMSAELGSMKVTEQIDAMEVSGINPFKYLAISRIVAAILVIPVLVIYADFVSLIGSFIGANIGGEITFGSYFMKVFEKLTFGDLFPALFKSFFFGFAIGLIGCFKGFSSRGGTQGVGRAANSAVVTSLFLVIIIDMIAAQLASIFNLL